MRHHYRSGFEWYDNDLDDAARCAGSLAGGGPSDGPDPAPFAQRVRDALDDDLDTPGALEALDDLASAALGRDDASRRSAARARPAARRRPEPPDHHGLTLRWGTANGIHESRGVASLEFAEAARPDIRSDTVPR